MKPSRAPSVKCAYDRMVPVGSLVPYPHLSRLHPDSQVALIAHAIQSQGWRAPITVSERSGFIVRGHGRLAAALRLGLAVAPVDFQAYGSEAEERADRLADNRLPELAEWDLDALRLELAALQEAEVDVTDLGFSASDLDEMLAGERADPEASSKVTDAAELQRKWKTALGQLWHLGDHRLVCGDATSAAVVARVLCGEKPSIMVTDPPYGVEYDPAWREAQKLSNSGRRGTVANDDRASWAAALRFFKGDVAYVWHAGICAAATERALVACGFEIRAQLIWSKPRFAISRGSYHWRHEPCWYAVRAGKSAAWCGGRKQQTVWADIVDAWPAKETLFAARVDDETVMAFDPSTTTVWEVGAGKDDAATFHGTQKPVECMARPLRNHGKAGDICYEPFSGSGSTIIACEREKRRCRAIELDPGYVAVALQRWADASGAKPRLLK